MKTFMPAVDQLNVYLFKLINAPAGISVGMLRIGTFFASAAVALFPLVLLFNWFWCGESQKKSVLYALVSMIFAMKINIFIGIVCQHPRPFMIPIGQHFLDHAANNSFPSNHMSLSCAISFSLIACGTLRQQGLVLFAVSMLVAWARVYMGVHFPLDIAASLGVALVSAILSLRCAKAVNAIYAYVYFRYHIIFATGIRKRFIK
ncbi:undecaprenyl-diphosphatase [Sodalis endosymbiont of Henestaris halophilus]|uniref:undecaprenyl-diphosphatase n=1 Tax=Sodalis endosymbiont of Henestaris halophilus TaxID=1929246 RepID=UPI000BBFAA2E|nr:undecaprenyl-diphosphatase [Sodalis endosymbiont of Henestaris halophilus]SNC58862.1 Putative undecaprenyl-diphosphatase YbjG [Sodalis endosymbiont of Henestaris halophilus]